ncbi:MAG: nitroreductase [Alphaproteobacteria bacterium]
MSEETATARYQDGAPLEPVHPNKQTLDLLRSRRSAKFAELRAPGPSKEQLMTLLAIASRAPDHGKLVPWRFLVIEGAARAKFGELLAKTWAENEPASPPERLALERGRFANTPVIVGVVSRVTPGIKIPVWEQELSSGAVCTTLLIAANAMGFSGSWITEWYGYDKKIFAALGLKANERIAGFVGLGTVPQVTERARPKLDDLVSYWNG